MSAVTVHLFVCWLLTFCVFSSFATHLFLSEPWEGSALVVALPW